MFNIQGKLDKIGLIAFLVSRAPRPPGRTALMKWLYFLKTVEKVPLPYSFRLYTYGPYDSDVLDDLRYAEALGAVNSVLVAYSGGRRYEYQRGSKAEDIQERAHEFLAQHEASLDRMMSQFGGRSAGDLEMSSTIVYVDRSLADRGEKATFANLGAKVKAIKPHLAQGAIEREARALEQLGLLKAIA